MLASRMIKIAEDIRHEYQQFNIPGLLSEAAQLSGNRPGLNPNNTALKRRH
jgi:hypothetical protein